MLHCDCVTADPQRAGHVLAGVVGRGLKVSAALHIADRDFGVGHNRAGLVFDGADNAAGILLRPGSGRKNQTAQREGS